MKKKIRHALLAMLFFSAGLMPAAQLDLNGTDKTVRDVSEIAQGVTNSSDTPAVLTIDISADQTYSASLDGNLKLVKKGSGTLSLSPVNRTYKGGTLVCAGGKLKLGEKFTTCCSVM